MGMDYMFAGSASYPRFNKELVAIAEIFGGKLINENENPDNAVPSMSSIYWFGTINWGDHSDKFTFPEETNPLLVRWFNHVYTSYNRFDTRLIWDEIRKHPEIEDISPQIWSEFRALVECGEGWDIC